MPKDFGTPDARDGTAQDEKNVQQGAEYDVMLGKEMQEMYPRTLGSVKVSAEDRQREYEMARSAAEAGDPSHGAQLLVDIGANTLEKIVSYLKEMESKR